jgi:hypothetical protein
MTPLMDLFMHLFIFCVLQCSSNVFPSCLFCSLVDNTHILNLAYVIPLVFDHFVSQLAFVGLTIQSHNCSVWAPSSLPFWFAFLASLCYLIDDIRIKGSHLVLVCFPFPLCNKLWINMFVMLMCS